MLYGIDLSEANGYSGRGTPVDFQRVAAAGKSFFFQKCSEGHGFLDPSFDENIAAGSAANLVTGAYHYLHPDQDIDAQADFFVSHAFGKVNLPLMVDFETLGGLAPTAAIDRAGLLLDALKSRTGKVAGLYVGANFWNNYPSSFAESPLWIQEYRPIINGVIHDPTVPPPWDAWTFDQYAADPFPGIAPGRVDGVATNVDLNRFNGSMSDLCALCDRSPPGCASPLKTAATIGALAMGTFLLWKVSGHA